MPKEKTVAVHVRFDIKTSDIENLLDSASRGASYWAESELGYGNEIEKLMSGKNVEVVDTEDNEGHIEGDANANGKKLILNLAKVKKGLKVMAFKEPEAFAEFLTGKYDNDTGDTFLQCALFGEVIYS